MDRLRVHEQPLNLAGQRAVVTGASRGIGRAVAELLAVRNADVVLLARSRSDLEDVEREIAARGGRAKSLAVDINDDNALHGIFGSIGPVDILVNAAGVNRPKPFLDVSGDDLDALINLNLRAMFRVSQLFVRNVVERGSKGVIVNISSQMGHVGAPERSVYCATKHGVEGLTKALAIELAPKRVRVVSVAPTFIETAMTRTFLADPDTYRSLVSKIPIGRLGTLAEVAEAVAFAASPAAALVTGSSILVDGGWVAQ
ncbi:SDR family NAD(P)-dependent oxidoreductase [Mycolicibacterium wolinskyi]|uniref:SDR family NAD(P)-dependent oxidoreductase n=1 Tax=Mycolicibacterium wolinskyi TaxID=59750 RepID=UPI003917A607